MPHPRIWLKSFFWFQRLKYSFSYSEMMVNADFLNRLARDVVRMTEGEENGMRGYQLHIEHTDGAELGKIGKS